MRRSPGGQQMPNVVHPAPVTPPVRRQAAVSLPGVRLHLLFGPHLLIWRNRA
jgi:hypothetical protein